MPKKPVVTADPTMDTPQVTEEPTETIAPPPSGEEGIDWRMTEDGLEKPGSYPGSWVKY